MIHRATLPSSISTCSCSYLSSCTYKSSYIDLVRPQLLPVAPKVCHLNSFSIQFNVIFFPLLPSFPFYSSVLPFFLFIPPPSLSLPSLFISHNHTHTHTPIILFLLSPLLFLPFNATGPLSIPWPQLQCREVPPGTRTWEPFLF